MVYQNIVPLLVEALKEKDKEIALLKERMNKFEQGISSYNNTDNRFSSSIDLKQNAPNPFFSVTTIDYSIHHAGTVQVDLFTAEGTLIKTLETGFKEAGNYRLNVDGSKLRSGTYLYTLKLDGKQLSRKAIKL